MTPSLENLAYLPENIVIEAAEQMGSENNHFKKAIDIAQQFKAAELTPVYLVDTTTHELYVFAKELMGKKLH